MSKNRSTYRVGDNVILMETGKRIVIEACDHQEQTISYTDENSQVQSVPMDGLCRIRAWRKQAGNPSGRVREGKVRSVMNQEADAAANRLEARRDPDGHSNQAPAGYHLRGVSSLLDENGDVKLQWVKTQVDKDMHLQAMIDSFHVLSKKLPREPRIAKPKHHNRDDIMCVYPMGDPHLGMYAWAEETGDKNFDINIAERQLIDAVDQLVDLAPPAKDALIINLGDFFHSDNQSNRTARSGNALDVDSRWARILAVGVQVMCRIVERALEKHETVTVRNEIGNHDDHSAIMLSIAMQHHYHKNPRVNIDTSPARFWYHEFGKNLIGTTHGDTVKAAKLGAIMAVDQKEAWGRTDHRYWYTGHVHHESVKEFPGVVVETFRTLAPRDAWHAGAGYRSRQDMRLDVLHREYGRVNRHIVGIEQIQGM